MDEQPGIEESAVIGVPHPDFGETAIAIVVISSHFKPNFVKIKRLIENSLARYKHPKKIISISDLPRNTMGKVQKNILREEYKSLFL